MSEDITVLASTPAEKLLRVADKYRPRVMRTVLQSAMAGRKKIDLTALEILVGNGNQDAIARYLDRAIEEAATPFRVAAMSAFAKLSLEIMEAGGNATRCDFGGPMVMVDGVFTALRTAKAIGCFVKFNADYPEAIEWANNRAAKLVTEVSAESKKAIRLAIARSFAEKFTVVDAAKTLRAVVGLTSLQAEAVVNLHQRIITSPGKLIYAGKMPIRVPKDGMSSARLDGVLTKYADKLHRLRAKNIARTETIASANEGQMSLWRQAAESGALPNNVKHEWIASMSERTCQICSGLNGEIVVIGQPFSNGVTNPPAHPMCRCTTGLVAA